MLQMPERFCLTRVSIDVPKLMWSVCRIRARMWLYYLHIFINSGPVNWANAGLSKRHQRCSTGLIFHHVRCVCN